MSVLGISRSQESQSLLLGALFDVADLCNRLVSHTRAGIHLVLEGYTIELVCLLTKLWLKGCRNELGLLSHAFNDL